jgi:hypothetical protein
LIRPSQANELFVSPGWTLAQIIIKSFLIFFYPYSEWGFVIETILTGLPFNVKAKVLTWTIWG